MEKLVTDDAFAGLNYQDAGFSSLEEMVEAIDSDNYRLWIKALDWPVFCGIDSQTGVVHQNTSIKAKLLCTFVRSVSRCLGIERNAIMMWSFRKLLPQALAHRNKTQQAAKSLQHRSVTSRTADAVYSGDHAGIDI